MLVQTHLQQQSTIRLLWSGILAVGILWMFAAGNIESSSDYVGSNTGSNGIVTSVDMPLHVNGGRSLALKRFSNGDKDQRKSIDIPDPLWVLTHSKLLVSLPLMVANPYRPSAHFAHICQYQLQTLNISRAPPLV